jgi:hypothetical protein
MQRELGNLVDLVAAFEQAAGGLVPQIVEAQVLNPEQIAGSCERSPDALGIVGKDVFARLGLGSNERPGLRGVFEPTVVPLLGGRVLGVPEHAGSRGFVVVAPFEAADLGLPQR